MKAIYRKYEDSDFQKISRFYGKMTSNNCESNCLKSAWECFSRHPCFAEFRPKEFGIWGDKGEIVGVVRLQSPWNGAVYIDLYPQYSETYEELIKYAEEHFAGKSDSGGRFLYTNVLSSNKELQQALFLKGYEKSAENYSNAYSLAELIPDFSIPKDFQIKSLTEVYDFNKLNDLLWRAFNYEGEPPAFDAEVKLSIKHAWLDYQRDICMVAISPNGSYASFCGMWFDDDNKEAYLEPLATAKEFRNLGLAKACIYAALGRCKELGAKYAYVEPDEKAYSYYKSIGFNAKVREESSWKKCF